ncbi:hypothetical protein MHOCP_10710 [Moorella humiferrea]|uniref:Putative ribosomal protein YlxQ n=1 Tax=Neomoorella humiferrea TaxID=676965 RepID=A0A2T0ANE8_9FIRM|nr:ribosomal L7Ae/L30e/S12e/Gadd45 family protein [Moorella humiferrea]PRR70480.1 putative ribosomal protein YlxQ [Moorella humiferrea]
MNKVYNLLGLANRAGKVAWGYRAVLSNVARRRVSLVILAEDGSPRLHSKILAACREADIEVCVLGDKKNMGAALGKPPCAVVGITDLELARLIRQHVREVDA